MTSSLVPVDEELRDALGTIRFGAPVRHVYNPLDYAWAPHREYLERFGRGETIDEKGAGPTPWAH